MWLHLTAPSDYTDVPGMVVNFSPFDTSKTVSLFIVDDNEVEEVEMFLVIIYKGQESIDIPSNTASIYITSNDGKDTRCQHEQANVNAWTTCFILLQLCL